jgi:flavin reductase (DIM6/NTAB) family NADH-FMN oxidoreductase RutF
MEEAEKSKKSLGPKAVLYPTPVLVIGTYDKAGRPNIMTAAWGGICCSTPPCVAVAIRKKARYTYLNLIERGEFTISLPSEEFVDQADYIGMVSGAKEDKFAITGLTAVRGEFVEAPYVKEFPLVLECKVIDVAELGVHVQFVGEVLDVKADRACLDDTGKVDGTKLRPVIFGPDDGAYFGLGPLLAKAFSAGRRFIAEG